jgi:starch synthase (maltosyl-transferring)
MNHRQPANILYVSHTADLRGSAMSLRELLLNLDAQRFVPHVLLSKHGPFEEILAAAKVPCTVLTQRGFLNIWRIKQARDYMLKHQIALVHLNSAVPFCRDVGIAAHFAGIPVVWHIREDPEGKRVRRWSRWIRWLSDRIVVVSSDLEEHFKTTGKAVKIYNGVNLQRFSPQGNDGGWRERLGIDDKAFVFITVGTIEERKGQHLIVEALGRLVGSGRPAHLIIVGSALGPDDDARLDDALRRNPGASPLTHRVGRQQDVPSLLRSADCLVLPSTWEGFPRTIAEAMACGLPVISTPVGEIPEMLGPASGWLVPPGDIESLEQAMDNALGHAKDRNCKELAMGRAQEWSTTRHVERVQALYDDLLDAATESKP